MIHTTEYRFFSKMHGAFGAHFVFGGILALLTPSLLTIPYCFLMAWAAFRYIRCTYLTESFVEYASFSLLSTLHIALYTYYFATLAILLMHYKIPLEQSMILACISSVPPATMYTWAYKRKNYITPFTKNNNRVETSTPETSISPFKRNIFVGATVGASSLLYPYLAPYNASLFFVSISLYIIFLWLIFQCRNAISGLRQLTQEQNEAGIVLTFHNLETIQALRKASWIGRSVQWIFK